MGHIFKVDITAPLPEGLVATETALVMKCMDEEGVSRLCIRTSDGLSPWDAVGLFQTAADSARVAAQQDLVQFRTEEE